MAKRYSPKFKFQVVLEAIQDENPISKTAKAYGVHPVNIPFFVAAERRHFRHVKPNIDKLET